MCGHKLYYTWAATHRVSLFPLLSQDKMSWRRGDREGRRAEKWQRPPEKNISTVSEEPRAMSLINSAMWKLMPFMLGVGVWIIEIRVLCEIWRDSQLQMAYYPISSRDAGYEGQCRWRSSKFGEHLLPVVWGTVSFQRVLLMLGRRRCCSVSQPLTFFIWPN